MALSAMKQYWVVTANYWTFTLTDGALRMLVLLYFYQLGYSPFEIAMLFLFYEIFGVLTNLFGGWIGARWGLNFTLRFGLFLQIVSLLMLALNPNGLTVAYVMVAQAISGIAKDLNKMSAKSAVKSLFNEAEGQLYRWVAFLTGSKNTLKGVGFFLGSALLTWVGFVSALYLMAGLLALSLISSFIWLDGRLGKAKNKPKFSQMFAKSPAINWLSAARFFLFGARDIWFVVALPVYLVSVLGWGDLEVGSFLALWVIGYGVVQAVTPMLTQRLGIAQPTKHHAMVLAGILAFVPALMAVTLSWQPEWIIVAGLVIFGILFALNSATHSYLIVSYAQAEGTSTDVGFYYMANAGGRLLGTVTSGYVYQVAGMEACLAFSALFIVLAAWLVAKVPKGGTSHV